MSQPLILAALAAAGLLLSACGQADDRTTRAEKIAPGGVNPATTPSGDGNFTGGQPPPASDMAVPPGTTGGSETADPAQTERPTADPAPAQPPPS